MSSQFKIDFVGIGASKSGTTWLGHMLEHHPQLCMSYPKEVHFFNERVSFRHPVLKPNYQKGIDWYANHFRHCTPGKLKGEITPQYCYDINAAQRVYAHNPDIRFSIVFEPGRPYRVPLQFCQVLCRKGRSSDGAGYTRGAGISWDVAIGYTFKPVFPLFQTRADHVDLV